MLEQGFDASPPVDSPPAEAVPAPIQIAVEGKRVKRKDLLNLFNHINFTEGTIFVRWKHREQGNFLFYQAYPLPCLDENLSCRWMGPDLPLAQLQAYACDSILVTDGYSHVTMAADVIDLDAKGITFRIPLSAYEKTLRTMDRHASVGIAAQVIQEGIRVEGRLVDFNAVSFRVEVEGRTLDSLHWVNTAIAVTLMLHNDEGEFLYSGACTITRLGKGVSKRILVLNPNFSNMHRYKPREYRCKRQILSPAAIARFRHPVTGRQVYLQVENISCTGICVEEFFEHAVLTPGMVIPEIALEIANSFILNCRAQVLYRNVVHNEGERNIVHCGIVFLDMESKDQVQLSAIIHQSVDEKLRICASVDMDELWRFFFESGFIYPSKYLSIQSRKDDFKRTYEKLYLESPSIARHFLFQDKGQIFGHMSMLRYYSNSWIIHHHAASRSGYGLAGVSVLDEMGRFTNDVHLHPSAHMDYLMCYYRRENRFPNRVFGNVAQDIGDKKGSSLDAFAYLYLPPDAGAEGFQLFPARDDDLAELARRYESVSGGLMLEALDLGSVVERDAGLSAEYARQGFRRERQVFCLKREGKLMAVLLLTISDLGLNLSNLTNCMHAIVLEPALLFPKMLFSALHALRAHYGADEPPILVFPEDYLERYSVPYEKKYILWVLDTSHSDAYFESVRKTFKRSCREEDDEPPTST
jgi:hypothetical protein